MRTPHKPAVEIPVSQFRLLLQWPLFLDDGNKFLRQKEVSQRVYDDCLSLLGGDWEECDPTQFRRIVNSPLNDPPTGDVPAGDYQEYVYFHDFTQRFLYPQKPERPKAGKKANPTLDAFRQRSFWLLRNPKYQRLTACIAGRGSTPTLYFCALQQIP